MSHSSLSSVVSNLVRASIGSSARTVTDEDLDRHVAELILKEAKQKAERYGKDGIRAYLPNLSESNAPRTNKRFLTSIIRSTDDHNKTILRAQALAAQEVQRQREELERRERRARAEEAVAAERLRRRMRDGRRSESDSWDKRRDEDRRRKRKKKSWEDGSDYGSGDEYERERHRDKRRRHHRHKSRTGERDSHRDEEKRSRRRESGRSSSTKRGRAISPSASLSGTSDQEMRRHKRHGTRDRRRSHRSRRDSSRSRSGSRYSSVVRTTQVDDSRSLKEPQQSPIISDAGAGSEHSKHPKHSRRHSSPISDSGGREAELRRRAKGKHKQEEIHFGSSRNQSTTRANSLVSSSERRRLSSPKPGSLSSHTAMSLSRSSSPSINSRSQVPSKMDKYFEESYDPRLDVAPLAAPKVPSTGLIDNSEFEGWDAMLELIRRRREDKEEKKRMERLGLTQEKSSKNKKSLKKGAEPNTVVDKPSSVADRWGGEGVSIMDIEYKKKGSVREWDMGKTDF